MTNFFRKLLKPKSSFQPSSDEVILEQFFTNAETARETFDHILPVAHFNTRLLIIQGVGGVGKSTLLRWYRLSCSRQSIPVSITTMEEQRLPIDTLASWVKDLEKCGLSFSTFQTTLTHYRGLQAKVEKEAVKARNDMASAAGKIGRFAVKTAVAIAVSAIPVVGPFISGMSGEGTEAFIDWLHSFLSKPDLDLYLDPTGRLSADFIEDMGHISAKKRVVLMIDTYEQVTTFDTWLVGIAKQIPNSVILVIAGRKIPQWDKNWPGWMALAEFIEVKEMAQTDIRSLIHKYHHLIKTGEPESAQVEEIVTFARGLPLAATTIVQLWVKYGIGDFQAIRPQVVSDLVDRLLDGVPKDLKPAFEASAVARYFNVDTLHALLERDDCDAVYDELRRWPFIRPRREGLSVHDSMREMLNEALVTRAPQRYHALHWKAAQFYEQLARSTAGSEREKLILEQIYHTTYASEEKGMQIFCGYAEELVTYHFVADLKALLSDANTYPVCAETSQLWRKYYEARLAHLEERPADEQVLLEAILNSALSDWRLEAYACSDLGFILTRGEFLEQLGGIERATVVLEKALNRGYLDEHIIESYLWLFRLDMHIGKWDGGTKHLHAAQVYYEENNNPFGLINVHLQMAFMYTLRGMWYEFFEIWEQAIGVLARFTPKSQMPKAMILAWAVWPGALAGRLADSERMAREALTYLKSLKDPLKTLIGLRDLGWILGLQGKYAESVQCLDESISMTEALGDLYQIDLAAGLSFKGMVLHRQGLFERAVELQMRSMKIKEAVNDIPAMPETLSWLGQLQETCHQWDEAGETYRRCAEYAWYGNNYFHSAALLGLARVKARQNDLEAMLVFSQQCLILAETYEYNDHLAMLNLLRGEIVWDHDHLEWGCGFDIAQAYFQSALIYAMRYNRFLLDDVLGGQTSTPFSSIATLCREHGEEGKKMLEVLKNFWQTCDYPAGPTKTITRITGEQPLVTVEKSVRELEPGDGARQTTVIEQIDRMLM